MRDLSVEIQYDDSELLFRLGRLLFRLGLSEVAFLDVE